MLSLTGELLISSKSRAKLKQIPHFYTFASVFQRTKIDFTPHFLPVVRVVNATFVKDFHSSTKVLCSYEFSVSFAHRANVDVNVFI